MMMILQKKQKAGFFTPFVSGKSFMIGLMAATFMVFASGANSAPDSEQVISIIVGAGLFTLASGLLIWAREISRKL